MKVLKFPLEKTGAFPKIFLDYIGQKEELSSFYSHFPTIKNFQHIIETRKGFDPIKRVFLREAINTQYSGIEKSSKFIENLKLLANNNTFTVTTGHQLNLFTGPLYFLYKIISAINLCKKLSEAYPAYNFVPVYWMASEDHDVQEINHFYLFNKKYEWNTDQKGAVGRFHLHGIEEILEAIPEKIFMLERAYLHHKTLAEATRFLVNELFGEKGLIILDPDHPLFKKEMKRVFKDELFHQYSNNAVEETNKELELKGYGQQVFSRDINLFYLEDHLRDRIVKEGDLFKVINSSIQFDETKILELIELHPEKLSPNVILRPLYQEIILPNLAYVGGPAEIAYWLQLKRMFEKYKVSFPIIIPRNFGLWVNKSNAKKLNKINIDPIDLFLEKHQLKDKYLTDNGFDKHELTEEMDQIKKIFDQIQSKADEVDPSLIGFIGAEHSKVEKIIENIEKRLKKAEENKNEIALRQLESLKEKLFPEGGLQERTDNFLNFYINDSEFIDNLISNLDPLDFKMNVFIDE